MKLNSIEDTFIFSKKIGSVISQGDTILLYGEIGVGKTTFVRGLINNLEIEKGINKSQILSPTFNIVFDYQIKNLKILHYDLFRLKNNKDINELGIFDGFDDSVTIIEWPELIKEKPLNRIEMVFSYFEENLDKRNLEVKGYGKWNNYDFEKN